MTFGILAEKVGMTQVFVADGVRLPVTVLRIQPNAVVQVRTLETDGYTALQLGIVDKTEKHIDKPSAGHFAKAGVVAKRELREFRVDADIAAKYKAGDAIGVDVFADVKNIDVAAISKGKGFQGVMKRHNMKGFRATHGTHEYFRHGGSIGCRAKPGRVFKGKRMPGRMGNERVKVINLRIIQCDVEKGLLLVRGAVPGGKGAIVEITASTRAARSVHGIGGAEVKDVARNPMKIAKKAGR